MPSNGLDHPERRVTTHGPYRTPILRRTYWVAKIAEPKGPGMPVPGSTPMPEIYSDAADRLWEVIAEVRGADKEGALLKARGWVSGERNRRAARARTEQDTWNEGTIV